MKAVRPLAENLLFQIGSCSKPAANEFPSRLAKKVSPLETMNEMPAKKFLLELLFSDFGVSVACSLNIIFFLTSLFIDSIHQSVATNDRCISSP